MRYERRDVVVNLVCEHKPAVLVLQDGTVFYGSSFGAEGKAFGEVVFTTAMTGYQELLTDPATAGQIVSFTYPLIGNYGINDEDMQSDRVFARAVVVYEAAHQPSNYRATEPFPAFLARHGVVGILGIDTRALTRHLRGKGKVKGAVATGEVDVEALIAEINQAGNVASINPIAAVTTKTPYVYADRPGPRVAVVDLGLRRSTLQVFADLDCRVVVFPPDATGGQIVNTDPDLVVMTGGAGSANDVPQAVETVKDLAGKVPLLALGLGHLVVGAAFGGQSFTMPHGHRGGNIPVKDLATGRVYITAQHHGEALVDQSWKDSGLITSHVHVNDTTVEGLAHRDWPLQTFQYHPEAVPGPHDSIDFYRRLIGKFAIPRGRVSSS